jgi:peptidoglycan/LPS O-acetylase OafA/YrhL
MGKAGLGIRYSPEIDGLRAIAVLAVVSYHAGVGGAGFVGVDVFFAISGYLITALLLAEWRKSGSIDLALFYARRVRRILPAVVLVVAVTLAVGLPLLSPSAYTQLVVSAVAAMLFGANFFFQATTGGYFDTSADQMPLLHLWSLAVEEQFYLAWPLALAWLFRLRERLPAAISVLAVLSFSLAFGLVLQGPQEAEIAFHQMPARVWELAMGGLVAVLPARRQPVGIAAGGLVLVLVSCAWPLQPFPGPGALPAVAGTALILLAVHGRGELGGVGACLRSWPMRQVGLLSYSLYLWHWPLLALYRATIVQAEAPATLLALCVLALLLAAGTYRYVEKPFRAMRGHSRRFVIAGATSCFVLAGVASALAWATRAGMANDNPVAASAEGDMPPRICHSTAMEIPAIKCPPVPRTRVAIWGDSLAYAWSPLVWQLDPNASAISRDACQPYLGYLPAKPYPADWKCRDFNSLVAARVRGLDTLVLVGRWNMTNVSQLRQTLDAVARGVRRVVVLGPTPQLRAEAGHCIRQKAEAACALPRAEFDAIAGPILASLRASAASHPNVTIVDLTDSFCTATNCPVMLHGIPLYWDAYHVSSSAAKAFELPMESSRREQRMRAGQAHAETGAAAR